MKIAVAGSHSTGKSTLARRLARRLGYKCIHDIVKKEAHKKGFEINENTPLEVQVWLTARQWELEKLTPEGWVADKCLFDYLVYAREDMGEDVISTIRKFIERNACYDFVFYLPIEIPLELDGVRSSSHEFHEDIDRQYRKCLDEFGVKYIVLSGSVEERINQALEYIKGGK